VPRRLTGLTIDGATPAGGRATLFGARFRSASATLEIDADSVTLTNLTLVNLPAEFRSRTDGDKVEGVTGARVTASELRFEHTYPAEPRVKLSFSRGARVEGNRFTGAEGGGITLDGTEGSTIAGNTFEAGGVTDHDSRGLEVERNTAPAGFFFFETETATIARNTFGAKARVAVGDVADGGLIRVTDNTIDVGARRTGLVVAATTRIEVRGNTVKGVAGQSSGISAGCREQHPGLAIVERNRITGLRTGLTIVCAKREGRFVVRDNTVRGNSHAGVVVRAHDVMLGRNTVEGNGTGILVERRASIRGATVRGNRRAGILVQPKGEAQIQGVLTGGNGGPGIDLAPPGVSPNAARKTANDNIPFPEAKYDGKTGKLRGTACDGCTVEVYESEDGSKRGNPKNGEGRKLLGTARAGADGRWAFPSARSLDCPRSGKVTMTATRGDVTSEFSVDVDCGCLLGKAFHVSGAGTPRAGFRSYGLRVLFPKGSKVERAVLADAGTNERPAADALGEWLQWEEVQRDVPAPAGFLGREYLINVSYKPDQTGISLSRVVWRYAISYEPPRSAPACAVRVTEIAGRAG
jgi:parallel beta-helix repeat protein